ncbi:signal peptidase I [Cellulomonas sp. S1-8]|uniref:signal peptidase I n=1 Tax=Cellulomonas sp. S1-8 TaxID=2904790 RepID=UPI002243E24B|nr:signal peptidase I [Cellulomonas sp. S1-8]UZN02489.1 signal peptidase I [Cellulomonas sp. S1-8]
MTTAQRAPEPFVDRRATRPAVRRRTPWWRRATSAALWGIVVVGVLAYLTSLAVPLWFQSQGQRLLIVTSGSMAPQFVAGDVVVLRAVTDASELKPGLVVTFQPVGATGLVTHRIVSLHSLPAMQDVGDGSGRMEPVLDDAGEPVMQPYIRTQGDANRRPDANATPVERVRGVLLSEHHGWGSVLTWATSPQGRAVMLVPPLLALAALEVVSVVEARRRARASRRPLDDRRVDALLLD